MNSLRPLVFLIFAANVAVAEDDVLHRDQMELGKKLEIEVFAPSREEREVFEPTKENLIQRYLKSGEAAYFTPSFKYENRADWRDSGKSLFEKRLELELEGLDDAQKFENLQRYMISPIPANEMCVVLSKVAKMYVEVGDLDEALEYASTAHLIRPYDRRLKKMYKTLDDKVNPKPSLAEKIRAHNGAFGKFMNLSLGIEHATNVIQEAINTALPTYKKDFMLSTNFMTAKSWAKKIKMMSQETRLSLSNSQYERHTELNIFNSSLDHSLSHGIQKGDDTINYGAKIGLGHIFSTHNSLLMNKILGANMVYFKTKEKLLINTDLTFTRTDYFAEGSAAEEGYNLLLNIGAMKFLDDKGLQTLRLDLSQGKENPNDPSLRYDETSTTLGYRMSFKDRWLSAVSPSATYKMRDYSFDGGTGKREDKQWTLSFDIEIPIDKKQRFNLRASSLENKSNQSSSHYKNSQISVTYNIDL